MSTHKSTHGVMVVHHSAPYKRAGLEWVRATVHFTDLRDQQFVVEAMQAVNDYAAEPVYSGEGVAIMELRKEQIG